MPVAHVLNYTTEDEVLRIVKTARDEMKAELAVLDKALKAQDLNTADDRLNRIWVQANWVRDLSGAFLQSRPRTVKSRLEYIKQSVHSAGYRQAAATQRESELKKLEKPAAKKTTARKKVAA